MARKRDRDEPLTGPWAGERTMAEAEEDVRGTQGATRCLCGSETLVLQAFTEVRDGVLAPRPIELETLTCPECGREYEPVELQDGRIVRGDFLGQVDLAEEEELS